MFLTLYNDKVNCGYFINYCNDFLQLYTIVIIQFLFLFNHSVNNYILISFLNLFFILIIRFLFMINFQIQVFIFVLTETIINLLVILFITKKSINDENKKKFFKINSNASVKFIEIMISSLLLLIFIQEKRILDGFVVRTGLLINFFLYISLYLIISHFVNFNLKIKESNNNLLMNENEEEEIEKDDEEEQQQYKEDDDDDVVDLDTFENFDVLTNEEIFFNAFDLYFLNLNFIPVLNLTLCLIFFSENFFIIKVFLNLILNIIFSLISVTVFNFFSKQKSKNK